MIIFGTPLVRKIVSLDYIEVRLTSADAFNELGEKLALLPIIELIKIKALLPSDPRVSRRWRFPPLRRRSKRSDLETPSSSHGRSAELLHKRVEVCHAPMLLELAVVRAHRVDGLELSFFARGRNTKECSLVRSVIGLEGRHDLPFGGLPMDHRVEVGERLTKGLVESACTGPVRRHVRLGCMVEKIVREEFFEDVEVPFALAFLGIPADDRLRGLAR